MYAHGDTKDKIANAIIYFARHATPKGKPLGLTKLMKLLFYLDFEFYQKTGFSSTGLEYYAWQQGPVPRLVWNNLKENDTSLELKNKVQLLQIKEDEVGTGIKAKKNFDSSIFTKLELKILESLSFIYQECTAKNISDISHERDKPWDTTKNTKGLKAQIDYNLALPRNISPEDLEELQDRQEDFEFLQKAFG